MPQYKLLAMSHIARKPGDMPELLPAGTEIEFGGNPGTNLEPMDDAGAARQEAYFKSKGITREVAVRRRRVLDEGGFDHEGAMGKLMGEPQPGPGQQPGGTPQPVTDHVAIPDDFETWADWQKIVILAARLGAPEECRTKADAVAWIKKVQAERAAKAAA